MTDRCAVKLRLAGGIWSGAMVGWVIQGDCGVSGVCMTMQDNFPRFYRVSWCYQPWRIDQGALGAWCYHADGHTISGTKRARQRPSRTRSLISKLIVTRQQGTPRETSSSFSAA